MTARQEHIGITGRLATRLRSREGLFRSFIGSTPDIDEELLRLSRKFSAPPPDQLAPTVDLATYLVQLIAHYDGVPEQTITYEYRCRRREEDIYPNAVYAERTDLMGSSLGGYDGTWLEHRTQRQYGEFGRRVDEQLSRF